jgi:hypothetical protein
MLDTKLSLQSQTSDVMDNNTVPKVGDGNFYCTGN